MIVGAKEILIVALMIVASPASAQVTDEERSLARLKAAFEYYTEKGQPVKAQQNLQAMYFMLQNKEAAESKRSADKFFYVVTGIKSNRYDYFKSMGIIDGNGGVAEIAREREKGSFTCSRHWTGEVTCYEN